MELRISVCDITANFNFESNSHILAGALQRAFTEHFNPQRVKPNYAPGHAPTTILVITYIIVLHFDANVLSLSDGEPNDAEAVKRELVGAANRILDDIELSVSFIQIVRTLFLALAYCSVRALC